MFDLRVALHHIVVENPAKLPTTNEIIASLLAATGGTEHNLLVHALDTVLSQQVDAVIRERDFDADRASREARNLELLARLMELRGVERVSDLAEYDQKLVAQAPDEPPLPLIALCVLADHAGESVLVNDLMTEVFERVTAAEHTHAFWQCLPFMIGAFEDRAREAGQPVPRGVDWVTRRPLPEAPPLS